MIIAEEAAVTSLEDIVMIKALFWCFLVLFSQLWLLRWVDGRVLGMQFGDKAERDELPEEVRPEG